MKLLPLLLAVGFVTCSETVKLNEQARRVEFINHEYMGKNHVKCTETAQFEVTSIPKEVSGEKKYDVLDVKALNQGRKIGATHVLRWPAQEWPCGKDGGEKPDSERMCARRDITAYECIVGR